MAHDTAPEEGRGDFSVSPTSYHQPPTTNHHEETNSQGENSLNESRNDTLPGLEETVFHSDGVSGNDLSDDESYFANSGDEVNHETPNLDSDRPADRGSDRSGTGNPPGDGSELAELPAEPDETDEPVGVNLPHVAPKTEPQRAAKSATESAKELPHVAEKPLPKNVLKFATRGKSKQAKPRAKSTSKSATRGKSAPVIEPQKGSKGTWCFRLRWNSEPGRPVAYVSWVSDAVYEMIRQGDYDAFKRQLIESHCAKTLRASNTA